MAMLPINRIPEILKRMDLNTSQAEAMKTCFGILAIMSREDANKSLIAKDGMEIMLNAMTVHIDRTDVQEAGCDLLWSLAFNSNTVKEIIAKYNGAVVLVRALKRHSRSADFLKSACGALSNICQFRQNQEAVASQGGLQPLVGSVHVHQTNSKLLPFIFDAIASIIVNNEENARGVSSLGIIPIVVSSLSRHKGSKEVVKSGCHTLAILSDVKGQASKIAFAGGVPIILTLLDLHPHYSDLHRVAAVVLLRMLQESAHVGREICCNEGVRILLTSLEQGGAQQDTVAAVTHILYTITNPASPAVASIEPQLWCKPPGTGESVSGTMSEGNSGKTSPTKFLSSASVDEHFLSAANNSNNGNNGSNPGSVGTGGGPSLPQTALRGVLSVLQQYAARRDVVRAACRLLSNLSSFENIPLALDSLGVLDRIYECVHHHPDAKDVLESSVTFLKLVNKVKAPNFSGSSLPAYQGILHALKMKHADEEVALFACDLLRRSIESSTRRRAGAAATPQAAGGDKLPVGGGSGKAPVHILDSEEWCNKALGVCTTILETHTTTKEAFLTAGGPGMVPSGSTNNLAGNPPALAASASMAQLVPDELAANSRVLRQPGKKICERAVGAALSLLELLFMQGKVTDSPAPPTNGTSSVAPGNGDGSAGSSFQRLFQLVQKLYLPAESGALEFLLSFFHRLYHSADPAAHALAHGSPPFARKLKELKAPFGQSAGSLGSEGTAGAGGERSPGGLLKAGSLASIAKSSSASDLAMAGAASPLARRVLSRNPSIEELPANCSVGGQQGGKLAKELSGLSLAGKAGGSGNGLGSSGMASQDCVFVANGKFFPKHPLQPQPMPAPTHLAHGHGHGHGKQAQHPQRLLENWPNYLERLLPNPSNFPPFRPAMGGGYGPDGLYLGSSEIPGRMHLVYESLRPGGRNIVSRCPTPVPYNVPPGGLGAPFEHSLTFESEFESGNLLRAVQVGDAAYDLLLRADIHTQGHTQWFYFAVANTHPHELVKLSEQGVLVPSVRVTFSIVNFTKPDSLFNLGMRPVVYSAHDAKHKGVGWVRAGTDISYRGNSFSRNNTAGEGLTTYYTLSFTLEFQHPKDTVLVAYSYPYTVSDYRLLLSDILSHRPHADHVIRRVKLCTTLGGEDCDLLAISDFAHDRDKIGPIALSAADLDSAGPDEAAQSSSNSVAPSKKDRRGSTTSSASGGGNNGPLKPALFISGRVHPGETPASWMMKGILEFLTSDNSSAKLLRKLFVIFVVPMLNPDGVIYGNNRCSLAGVDLNRQWKAPMKGVHPTIFALKNFMLAQKKLREIAMFVDLHGHSRKYNVFMYGCDDKKKPKPSVRVFPKLLASHAIGAKYVCFNDCSFHVKKGRESTARVVVAKEMNIPNSFTLEATFCGSNYGPLKNCHMNLGHLQEVGAALCDSFLQFSLQEGYGKNVVNILGPITSTDYQVSNLVHFDPELHQHPSNHSATPTPAQQHSLPPSAQNSLPASTNPSRRNSASNGPLQAQAHAQAAHSQLQQQQREREREQQEREERERLADNQSVTNDDSDSDDEEDEAENNALAIAAAQAAETSSHAHAQQSGGGGKSSSSSPGRDAGLYHPSSAAKANKIDLALSIIQAETQHAPLGHAQDGLKPSSSSQALAQAHSQLLTSRTQQSTPTHPAPTTGSGLDSAPAVRSQSSKAPSSELMAGNHGLFFDSSTSASSSALAGLGQPSHINGSIVWGEAADPTEDFLRPKPAFDSVSDLVASKRATTGKSGGSKPADKPKPSNGTSSSRMKLMSKTLELSVTNSRGSSTATSPRSQSHHHSHIASNYLSSSSQLPPSGAGEAIDSLRGSGATIFKSEYSDLFFQSQRASPAATTAGSLLLNLQTQGGAPNPPASTSDAMAIATPFGLPRVSGAQSK